MRFLFLDPAHEYCADNGLGRVSCFDVHLGDFTRLGLLTVPVSLIVATVVLWAMLQATGG